MLREGERVVSEINEERHTRATGEFVDEETAGKPTDETDDGSKRDGRRGLPKRDTADENDCFQTCVRA